MVMNKAQIMDDQAKSTITDYKLTDMSVVWIDKDCAMLHYTATASGAGMTANLPWRLHALHDGVCKQWRQMARQVHQSTPIMAPMAH